MTTQIKERNYNLLILTIFFCAILIILSNYAFTKNISKEIIKSRIEGEYEKIGGKDNYFILKELQKEEIITYLDTLREERPEYIERLRKKAELSELKKKDIKILSEDTLLKLKTNTYIKGNSGALLTILEFSDLECPYCKDFHNAGTIDDLLIKYSEDINYSFKHFPLPKHENSKKEAGAVKCVENLGEEGKSLEYINSIFKNTSSDGEGYDLSTLAEEAGKLGVDKEEFISCYNEEKYKNIVAKEFNEAIFLGLNSTPSNVIINNKTLEYIVLPGIVSTEKFEEIIDLFILDK